MRRAKQIGICIIFLILNLILTGYLLTQRLTLHQQLRLGLIQPDSIAVSAPLPDTMTDEEAQQLFEALTAGFSRQYPGFGIQLKLYANPEEIPADSDMYLNYQAPDIPAAALTPVFRELNAVQYFPELTAVPDAVPLSFSLPAVYYDMTDLGLLQQFAGKHSAERNQLSIQEIPDFSAFLEQPSEPGIARTSDFIRVEQNPAVSGRIHMLPVSENGIYQKFEENLCRVSAAVSQNHQKIAMLWIEYLLSEQAQTVLFSEHYSSSLPLHKKVFDRTISQHQELKSLKEIRNTLGGNMQ